MELRNDLYTVKNETQEDNGWQYEIALNPDSFIYQAHFPGEPITPGACLLQIARELLEEQLQTSLVIVYIKDVKFMSVIKPEETPTILYRFSHIDETVEDEVKVRAMVVSGNKSLCSLSFTCKKL